ncbi:MAG TPA: radical SAM family heme chaperone HemW [Elusimicrobiales bacterium]|nr:radical SAM family heme chaperone HemW [Elusimicrobiales bacterium]HPO95502.1 radical SAM family heme chaperone HemW [Elusimicrobiales bacterium]
MIDPFFSVYVHIPFCKKKCNYCSFYSLTDKSLTDGYLNSVNKEINLYKDLLTERKDKYKTIYFGGGTPSFLSLNEMEYLLDLFNEIKPLKNLYEADFELNPESVSEDKLRILKDFGINRVSIGVQSSNDEILNFLGRVHSYKDFLKKYDIIIKYFENVSLDLIYGIPGESEKDLLKDLDNITSLFPKHISLYALETHKNTFFENLKIDEEKQSDFYFLIRDFLVGKGYIHYEISNFALKGYFSKHNLNYWDRGEYLGLGPSASSFISNKRWKNKSDLKAYIRGLNNGKIEFEHMEELDEKDELNEKLMLELRKIEGLDLNSKVYKVFKEKIDGQIKKGYMEILNGKVKIKKDFLFVSNKIISDMMF